MCNAYAAGLQAELDRIKEMLPKRRVQDFRAVVQNDRGDKRVADRKPIKVDNPQRVVTIDYTNWSGQRRIRDVKPIEIEWGATKWHPVNQWLLRAKDMEDGEVKMFALQDIHSWTPAKV
jgi:hypothetical protein